MREEVHKGGSGGTWCGPAAIAAVADVSYETAAAAINEVRGRAPTAAIKGARIDELATALRRLGVSCHWEYVLHGSLRQWASDRDAALYATKCIVLVTRHFIAVHGSEVVDSQRLGKHSLADCGHRRKHVRAVLRIEEN